MDLTSWIRLNNHTTQGICVLESSSISALIRRLITTHMYLILSLQSIRTLTMHGECNASRKEERNEACR